MKKIQLTQGQVTLVSDCDYVSLSKHKWYAAWSPGMKSYYAVKNKSWPIIGTIHMHRVIMNPPARMVVDHVNGDTLDNRRENLRVTTQSQNIKNQKRRRSGQISLGTTFLKSAGKYQAQIWCNGRYRYLGIFATEKEAHDAYKTVANK